MLWRGRPLALRLRSPARVIERDISAAAAGLLVPIPSGFCGARQEGERETLSGVGAGRARVVVQREPHFAALAMERLRLHSSYVALRRCRTSVLLRWTHVVSCARLRYATSTQADDRLMHTHTYGVKVGPACVSPAELKRHRKIARLAVDLRWSADSSQF
jgi:hypothetical protein